MKKLLLGLFALATVAIAVRANAQNTREKFNENWLFKLDSANDYSKNAMDAAKWQPVTLPHDWSIGLNFDSTSPSGNEGACLRGGTGLYQKEFTLPSKDKGKNIFIDFDGVYMNSTVWINGHKLGTRPYGYSSFQYDMTPYLKFGGEKNVLKVMAENHQPSSRWYSGSGIYRNVWLEKKGSVYVDNWGTYITTPEVSDAQATVSIQTRIKNSLQQATPIELKTIVYDDKGRIVKVLSQKMSVNAGTEIEKPQSFVLPHPELWSIKTPHLYKAVSQVFVHNKKQDEYTTTFGVRSFHFDVDSGFYLNHKPLKIVGVCMHHDLGALGAAINVRAMQRQLEILKSMGINGIRTSHNPPAPEWLDLCDKMGFIVIDEAFDCWEDGKNKYDYHLYFKQWHKRDLTDQVLRDRNHPSVFMWSIGNEIPEQGGGDKDTVGRRIARDLSSIVKSLDNRPITSALTEFSPKNNIIKSGALDLLGFNYHFRMLPKLAEMFPGQKIILTETTSALQSRGEYLMPSDSIRRWAGFTREKNGGTPDFTCSAYDNSSAPWASTYEETLKPLLKYPFLSGMYMWTGFDYLGEPTPYPYPARSSYFGIVDLAGFPKDAYYLFKSVCTTDTVLHIFPHWNWKPGQKIDVWAYYNNADEVELFLNGKSLGIRKKTGDDLHVQWNNIVFEPGTLKAVSRKDGKIIKTSEIKTAGKAYKLVASADRSTINADGEDLSFVKITVEDKDGNMVPHADNVIDFSLKGDGEIAGLDNGCETDLTSFSNKKWRKAFNGLALAIVKAHHKKGKLTLHISADGLQGTSVDIEMK
ncbi:glycoside hydrolase family 2 TIM barrel-domain containing protein [Arachidicoccus soli]|uniref:DUF4982 domain-containing protein n=1 Tax=Arachidicoccus soli TaxID=2341117 RepID=A0A386HLW9_9BACT|nr:glycoside hydrolase family 2 TIM barrel-domain containing protein [Arachidicoccus soli]AYD46520.1 DUF4982 domain-containing protein [Arachidicoccus soli]